MRKRLLLLAILMISTISLLPAQTRYHELGLRSGGLNNFGFIYKRSTDQQKFLRLRLLAINTEINLRETNDADFLSAGAAVGFERRKQVSEQFYFIFGPELQVFGLKNEMQDRQSWNVNARLGYLLGFNYSVSDRFIIGLETIPGLQYRFGEDIRGQRIETLGFNLSSDAVALTALYRFSTFED